VTERTRLVGPIEMAALHAVPRTTAWSWNGRTRLPPPTWVVSSHELWLLEVVDRWSKQTGRHEAAIGRWTEHLDAFGEAAPVGGWTFESLYDLLRLGEPDTRVQEIGVPIRRRGRREG
jgi:hypothetical protein